MLKIIDTSSTPPGGWKFTDPVTGIKFPIGGGMMHSLINLLKEVENHRLAVGGDLTPGWDERVMDLMCQQNEHYPCVHDDDPGERKLTIRDVVRFLKIMAKFIDGGSTLVSKEEAERREAICLRCPKRTSESFCGGCKDLKGAIEYITQGNETKHASTIGSCHVCGCLLKVKIWMDANALANDGLEYPSHCWLNSTEQKHQDNEDQDHTGTPQP